MIIYSQLELGVNRDSFEALEVNILTPMSKMGDRIGLHSPRI
jgi:hypothetical protein